MVLNEQSNNQEMKMSGYRIIWPQSRIVSAAELILWAHDDVMNGLCTDAQGFTMKNNPTVEDAIAILLETGSVTFHKSAIG